MSDLYEEPCKECDGSGGIAGETYALTVVDCPSCNGTGVDASADIHIEDKYDEEKSN